MKLLHTADWHIGQNFYGYDRKTEHQYFFDWLKKTVAERRIDVLLVSGDVFDSPNPSAESQRMYYRFLYEISNENPQLQVVITAGNHDSAARLEAPQDLLNNMRVEVRGLIHRKADGNIDLESLIIPLKENESVKALCLAVPFLRQGDYPDNSVYNNGVSSLFRALGDQAKEQNEANLPLITMGHLHVSGSELSDNDKSERVVVGGLECIEADTFADRFDYVALGHLHKPQLIGGKEHVRYSGSPLPMSFSEKYYKQGVNLVEISDNRVTAIERIDFQPLVSLLSIPSKPQPLKEVLEELSRLPNGVIDETSPFLEIKVLETEPEPSKRFQIEQAIQEKAVRLARILAITPKTEQSERSEINPENWQNIQPLEMAQKVFLEKYGNEMPEHIEELLLHVMHEINE